MTNNQRLVAFKQECRVVSMVQEYPGYKGEIRWILVSDLSESELKEKYPDEVQKFTPFVYMSREVFAPIVTSHSNDRKHEIRMANSYDAYSFEDGTMERFHDELVINPFETEDWSELHGAIGRLSEVQQRRLKNKYFAGMGIEEIAALEGVSFQTISKSILRALELLKKYLSEG